MWLSPVHARRLGYLHHAHASGLTLSEYAARQNVSLAELMDWVLRLREPGIPVPERNRAARFIDVEVLA